ncbi:MauE/DoxX family redox-associated membrane protein [Pontibacter mucosus]|nr:MauE/DoxX family redox-associated membrane protein [Pontibacter mucosus]
MKKTTAHLMGVRLALITLWVYAAVSKWQEPEVFAAQLLLQPLPEWLTVHLVWALPGIELVAATCLVVRRYLLAGLWLSLGLLLLFTGYVGLAVFGFWEALPCACGGVLSELSWREHLVFNLLFTVLAVYGLFLFVKIKRGGGFGRAPSSGGAAYPSDRR